MEPITLLTGGGDKPYAQGLVESLAALGVPVEFVGSDDLDVPEIRNLPGVRFLNLRGDQNPAASPLRKAARVLAYYLRLVAYAATAEPRIFHILWNNKLELFDRTALMLYYRLLGKRVVLTVHNVNIGARDGRDGLLNRFSLRVQYALARHLFVHTERMRQDLETQFGVSSNKIAVIPFGVNRTVPDTALTPLQARKKLGLDDAHKVLLFFGNIAPYKGVEYLVRATAMVARTVPECRLVIAGRPKGTVEYWRQVEHEIRALGLDGVTIARATFIPDEDVEVYFKAADAVVLPYVDVYQSGVLFLAFGFGTPVIATDVGALREDVVEGVTGHLCRSKEPADIAAGIVAFLGSDLHRRASRARDEIRRRALDRHSWERVAELTCAIYAQCAPHRFETVSPDHV